MKYENLKELNKEIQKAGTCSAGTPPVINEMRLSQKYLIISSDPSSDTNKSLDILDKHSSFEERVIALVFFGSDDNSSVNKLESRYREYKDKFLDNFYWTHYSKCYSAGNPDSFWAEKFLEKEIGFFEPKLIIAFGSKVADFLLGKGKLKDRTNKIIKWNGVSVICCLHPSRDWNMRLRDEYKFFETWNLIRSEIKLD